MANMLKHSVVVVCVLQCAKSIVAAHMFQSTVSGVVEHMLPCARVLVVKAYFRVWNDYVATCMLRARCHCGETCAPKCKLSFCDL